MISAPIHCREGFVSFGFHADLHNVSRQSPGVGRPLHVVDDSQALRILRVDQEADDLGLRRDFEQQFKPLRRQTGGQEADAGEIATGPAKACDKAFGHRITTDDSNNWNLRGRKFRGHRRSVATGGCDDVDLFVYKLDRQRRQPPVVVVGPAVLHHEVLASDEAAFLQATLERGDQVDDLA